VLNIQHINEPIVESDIKIFKCENCQQNFKTKFNLKRHCDNYCKVKKEKEQQIEKTKNNQVNIDELDIDDKTKLILTVLMNQNKKIIDDMKEQMNQLEKKYDDKIKQIECNFNKTDKTISINENKIVNDKLIDIIINKNEKIKELKNNIIIYDDTKTIDNKPLNLILNEQIIMFREIDKYINATQLCKAGDKNFSQWYRLDSTKELISTLESNVHIHTLELIDKKVGGIHSDTWIHPDLAIQLAQWISPQFALQVSSWIRTLFVDGKVDINTKLLKEQEIKINKSTKKIEILENILVKKQRRIEYPESNVIYLLTTEDNKKNQIYIVGKATNLKKRLSTYNKTCEHEVIHYKSCKDEEELDLCEKLVLNKLKEYREQANRDRFILPIEKDIKLFTDIIDNCVDFI
jgi:hypothetical protein